MHSVSMAIHMKKPQTKKPRLTTGGIAISTGMPPRLAIIERTQLESGMMITVSKQKSQMLYCTPQSVAATSSELKIVSSDQII